MIQQLHHSVFLACIAIIQCNQGNQCINLPNEWVSNWHLSKDPSTIAAPTWDQGCTSSPHNALRVLEVLAKWDSWVLNADSQLIICCSRENYVSLRWNSPRERTTAWTHLAPQSCSIFLKIKIPPCLPPIPILCNICGTMTEIIAAF